MKLKETANSWKYARMELMCCLYFGQFCSSSTFHLFHTNFGVCLVVGFVYAS
jgi:hypothetical protein